MEDDAPEENRRFDHSQCPVCKTWFLGVRAFDEHRPCKLPLSLHRFEEIDGKYVLREDAARYRVMQSRAAKAREARG